MSNSAGLIFILGTGRSGTTWLGKIFDSHPSVLYRHEPDTVLVNGALPFRPGPEESETYAGQAAAYIDALLEVRDIKAAGSLPVFDKRYRSPAQNLAYRALVYALKALQRPFGSVGFVRHAEVPDLIDERQRTSLRYVLKSVSSLSRARLFSRARPEAKIIHIVRHPCGYVASRLRGIRLKLMQGDTFLSSLAEMPQAGEHGLTLDRLENLSFEEQLAAVWMLHNEGTMAEMAGAPNYRTVVYEELCRRPIEISRELFAFAGLGWDPQTEAFLNLCLSHDGRRERYFQTVRSPIKAAFKWNSELDADQIARITNLVADSLPGRLYFG